MSDETDSIKDRLDLAEIVGEYVRLKKAGNHYKGLCPFHQEKTPSFVVSPDKGIWHCFGACSEGGDVFSFVEKIEGIDFVAALKLMADRAGVELKQRSGSQRPSNERDRLYEVLALANRFYQEILLHQPAGQKATNYLKERGVKAKSMEEFELGYAPNSWDALQRYLAKKDFTVEEMTRAGLVGKSERGKHYDRFRGRIMFPIHDVQGRVVAFGGRIAPWHETGNEGKYVNSPETSIYAKRRVVYNLHRAKPALREAEACVVVEGYMDVVMLAQSGWPQVVASSGTAFTAEQVTLLSRFTNTLHFAFDADTAGVKAAQAATQEALVGGLKVATIEFPAGKDPAEVAQAGVAGLRKILSAPVPLTTLLLEQLRAAKGISDQGALLEGVLPLVARVANPIVQGEMIQDIAATLHVPEAVVIDQLGRLRTGVEAAPPAVAEDSGEKTDVLTAEQRLLGLAIIDGEVRDNVISQLTADTFSEEASSELYESLQALQGAEMGDDAVIDTMGEALIPYAEGLRSVMREALENLDATTPQMEGRRLLRALHQRRLEARLGDLQEALTASKAKDTKAALTEFQAVAEELAAVKAQE